MKEELLKLALRVEALSGPERHVDADIAEALGWHQYSGDNWIGPLGQIAVPSYTVSLDAAMTLVPKTMSLVDLTLSWEPPEPEVFPACSITWYPAAVIHNGKDWHALTASGATPALALTAAALRALAKEK